MFNKKLTILMESSELAGIPDLIKKGKSNYDNAGGPLLGKEKEPAEITDRQ
jgi:hypothetical protein